MGPMQFTYINGQFSLLLPVLGELSMFVHYLKLLLDHAMPEADAATFNTRVYQWKSVNSYVLLETLMTLINLFKELSC